MRIAACLLLLLFTLETRAGETKPAIPEHHWVNRLVTGSERFYAEARQLVLFPTRQRGIFPPPAQVSTQSSLSIAAVTCTSDERSFPAKVKCSAKAPVGAEWKGWLGAMRACTKVQLEPASDRMVKAISAELASYSRTPTSLELGPDVLVYVHVDHLTRERRYFNGCENVRNRPCDPAGSWPTDTFDEERWSSRELLGQNFKLGERELFPYAAQDASLSYAFFGTREEGWFVPARPLFVVGEPVKRLQVLESLLQTRADDPDDRIALGLTRLVVAIESKDARVQELATAFVSEAEARRGAMHFELEEIVRSALPIAREILAGRYDVRSACQSGGR